MTRALKVDPVDTVATLLGDGSVGEQVRVGDETVTATSHIGHGHKIALTPVASGAPVMKYGFPIGVATQAIGVGDHVHSHNLATALTGTLDYIYAPPRPRLARRPMTTAFLVMSVTMAVLRRATRSGFCRPSAVSVALRKRSRQLQPPG